MFYAWVPGDTVANTSISLPADAPSFHELTRVEVQNGGQYTQPADIAVRTPTIVTETPAAGEVQLVDSRTIEFGDAIDAFDEVRLYGIAYGERIRVA